MFQFDEDWDPEEEVRVEREQEALKQQIDNNNNKQHGDHQQQEGTFSTTTSSNIKNSSNDDLYEDYFAMDLVPKLMPVDQQQQKQPQRPFPLPIPSTANNNSNSHKQPDEQHHHSNRPNPVQQQQQNLMSNSSPAPQLPLRFLEHPRSDFIVRSRPAQLSCSAANAQRIRVKCNAKWLDDNRVRLERGLDTISGQPTLRAHVDIQRMELDAWLADLGEFACQCWAFGDKVPMNGAEEEEEVEEDHEEEEDDVDDDDDLNNEDEDGFSHPSTSREGADNQQQQQRQRHQQHLGTRNNNNNAAAIRSETARIRLAYLRKHFNQIPISQRVHEGRTVQLQCQPPDGDPKPEIFWHKNGQQLSFLNPGVSDTESENDSSGNRDPSTGSAAHQNLIQAGDGSLILSAVRLSDAGNYSCEARNAANRRMTEPAEIWVYVDGNWSPWSDWEGECSSTSSMLSLACPVLQSQLAMVRGDADAVQRVLPRQRRTRTCNNPAPLSGGTHCHGANEEFRDCAHGCRLDGAWTQWTPWSSYCDTECRRDRRRECAAPAPANSGLNCTGPIQQWRNCSGEGVSVPEHCQPEYQMLHAYSHRQQQLHPSSPVKQNLNNNSSSSSSPPAFSARPLFDSQLLAFASLGCVAFLLFVIVLLAGLLICARKKRAKNRGILGDASAIGVGHCPAAGIFLDREEKLYFPGAAVATTAEDEHGNVHTVLLSTDPTQQRQHQAKLLGASVDPSPAHFCSSATATPGGGRFFSLKPGLSAPGIVGAGLHPTVSTPTAAGSAARMAAFLHSPNSYTLRSWNSQRGAGGSGRGKSNNGHGDDAGAVQPYASGLILKGGGAGRSGSRMAKNQQRQKDVGGSRIALLPEYSSSSQGSNRTNGFGGGGSRQSSHQMHRSREEENDYATLYEEFGGGGRQHIIDAPMVMIGTGASMESMAYDTSSGPDYACSAGSSSAGTQPIGGNNGLDVGRGDGPTFVAVEVDQDGAKIELTRSGAALTIDKNTFTTTTTSSFTIFLSVSDSSSDRPSSGLDECETWLSSVVAFGPCIEEPQQRNERVKSPPPQSTTTTLLRLERPVMLSAEHCASLFPSENSWLFTVWAELDEPDGQQSGWQRVWEEEKEDERGNRQRDFSLHMDKEQWHLLTCRTGRFILSGRQRRANVAAQKRVHLCAYWTPSPPTLPTTTPIRHQQQHSFPTFLPPPPPPPPRPTTTSSVEQECASSLYDPVPMSMSNNNNYNSSKNGRNNANGATVELAQIRVYCVPETAMSIESVQQQERCRFGGVLLAEASNFLLQPRGSLCCCLEQIIFPNGEGHPTGGSQYLEIPDQLHRWCAQNGLHFQLNVFGLLSSPSCQQLPRSVRGRIVLYQKGKSIMERQVLSFCYTNADEQQQQQLQHNHVLISRDDSSLSRFSNNGGSSAYDSSTVPTTTTTMEMLALHYE